MRRAVLALLALAVAVLPAGCGGGDAEEAEVVSAPRTAPAAANPARDRFEAQVRTASAAESADFPAARGRTLQQIADLVDPGPQVGLATSVYTPGRNRFAFGVIGADSRLIFAPSAIYVAPDAGRPARGPFVAELDPLLVEPEFSSAQSAGADDIFAAIYRTQIELPTARRYEILIVSRVGTKLLGAPTVISVTADSPVPEVGEAAPVVPTDTLESAAGDLEAIETRDPTDDLHGTSLDEVAGKRPVAVVFSTPALCESRVCGPVLDLAVQLEAEYGDRMEFIHQEVFVDNRPEQGFRPPLKAFGLPTEPWLFTLDEKGRVAARLEGSFGINEMREALEAALRERPNPG